MSLTTATGYSVDNIAPFPPDSLFGEYVNNNAIFSWAISEANDLSHYNIYKNNQLYTSTTQLEFSEEINGDTEYSITAVDVHENESEMSEIILISTSLDVDNILLPEDYELKNAYPNPFNPITNISFSIPQSGLVSINIYDINGELVTKLIDKPLNIGYHSINWDGSRQPSGMYFVRMDSGDFTETQKVVLIK